MVVDLYNFSKRPNSTKLPNTTPTEYHVCMIDTTSIINPKFSLKLPQNETFIDKNYAYVPYFNRYYFITDISYDLGTWILSMKCDVLASAKSIIGASTQYVARSASEYDGDVIDTAYPAKTEQDYELVSSSVNLWGNSDPCFIVSMIGGSPLVNAPARLIRNYDGSVVHYVCSHEDLYRLTRTLLSDVDMFNIPQSEMSQALQKQLINPIQYIHSIRCLPFTPETEVEAEDNIICGFDYPVLKYVPVVPE